jgi:membrane-associated phospholipid phosphatase
VVTLLVGFSRMLLGVHYFSDVLAGYVEAAAWLAICLTAVETLRRSRAHRAAVKPSVLEP